MLWRLSWLKYDNWQENCNRQIPSGALACFWCNNLSWTSLLHISFCLLLHMTRTHWVTFTGGHSRPGCPVACCPWGPLGCLCVGEISPHHMACPLSCHWWNVGGGSASATTSATSGSTWWRQMWDTVVVMNPWWFLKYSSPQRYMFYHSTQWPYENWILFYWCKNRNLLW